MPLHIKMRALTLSCIAAASIAITIPAHAGVFDGGALEITQILSWAKQYQQKQQELDQLREHFESVHGARMMANLVNNPEMRKYLPKEFRNLWQGSYEDSEQVLAILQALPEFDANQLYEQRLKQMAINSALINKAYMEASRRFEDIQVLLDKINDMEDDKEIQDLAARIQAESVMIQNEQTKITMLMKQMDIQEEQRAHQVEQRVIESRRSDREGSIFYGKEFPKPYQR